jgi:uncharacterized delta-60 repeat protein
MRAAARASMHATKYSAGRGVFASTGGRMASHFEALEQRRLLAGGLDPSFAAPHGLNFDPPGDRALVHDVAIDPAGRIMVVGQTDTIPDSEYAELFVSRVHVNGDLDSKWGVGGWVGGTPRGIKEAHIITPLRDGGYIVAGVPGFQSSFIRLKPNGRVDPDFGKNGRTRLPISVIVAVLEQDDGHLLILGWGERLNPETTDADHLNYMVRLNPDGKIDRSFGDGGWVVLGEASYGDGIISRWAFMTSAILDSAGRVVIATAGKRIFYVNEQFSDGQAITALQRFLPDGTLDTTFSQSEILNRTIIYNPSWTDEGQAEFERVARIKQLPSGSYAALTLLDTPDDPAFKDAQEPQLTVVADSGGLGQTVSTESLAPNFFAHAFLPRDDGSFIVAGVHVNGTTREPALIQLNDHQELVNEFGVNGMMVLPSPTGGGEATMLVENPDGTITVAIRPVDANSNDVRLVRIFPDDRPAIALEHVRQDEKNLRVTISARGINTIDPSSFDDFDLRLQNSAGQRTKLRFVDSLESIGVHHATYRVSLDLIPAGRFSIRAIAGAITDDEASSNAGGVLGVIDIA